MGAAYETKRIYCPICSPLYLDEKSGKPTRYNVYQEDLKEAINGSRNLQHMMKYLTDKGYEIDFSGSHWKMKLPQYKHSTRLDTLDEHIKAVKDSICLYSTDDGALSGKTSTEEVNGLNTSGWFIGYVEKNNHTYFFATNIQSGKLASGPLSTELTFSILSDLKLWDTYQE